jgi:hypothetical protein
MSCPPTPHRPGSRRWCSRHPWRARRPAPRPTRRSAAAPSRTRSQGDFSPCPVGVSAAASPFENRRHSAIAAAPPPYVRAAHDRTAGNLRTPAFRQVSHRSSGAVGGPTSRSLGRRVRADLQPRETSGSPRPNECGRPAATCSAVVRPAKGKTDGTGRRRCIDAHREEHGRRYLAALVAGGSRGRRDGGRRREDGHRAARSASPRTGRALAHRRAGSNSDPDGTEELNSHIALRVGPGRGRLDADPHSAATRRPRGQPTMNLRQDGRLRGRVWIA